RRRTAKIYKAKMSLGAQFAVKHGCDFACFLMRVPSQSISGCDRLRQPEIDFFEQPRGSLSVPIEFGEHTSMEGVVHGRGYLRRDDAMALRIHQEDSGSRVELVQIIGDLELVRAFRPPVVGFAHVTTVRFRAKPFDMLVHRVSWNLALRKRFQILPGQLQSGRDTCVDVVALLEVQVLEEIAAHTSRWNGIAIHVRSGEIGDRSFYRHQPLAEVLVNTRFYRSSHGKCVAAHFQADAERSYPIGAARRFSPSSLSNASGARRSSDRTTTSAGSCLPL